MNEYLKDIVNRIAEQITDLKDGGRSPKKQAYANLFHGVEHLIIQLWKGTQIHYKFEGGIPKRSGWYSAHPQYRDPNLTDKQTVAAYDGLIALGLIQETQRGYFN